MIASVMLPHIKNRPLSLYRFPDGADKEGFYQKDMPEYFPVWMEHVGIKQKRRTVEYVVCGNKQNLVYIASQVAEFHIWTSTKEKLGYPDKMVFDLDPSDQSFDALRKVAKKLGKLLEDIGFMPYLMSTGKSGYHVVAPLYPEQDNAAVRAFALKIATVLENDDPGALTTELFKKKRKNKVFIDVNRNSPHQTSIAPYSVRAVQNASVALPLEWNEIGKVRPGDYDIGRTMKRMQRRQDPWIDFRNEAQSLKEVIGRLKK
jgi:bifunctional non-homologous end joining protein LigD